MFQIKKEEPQVLVRPRAGSTYDLTNQNRQTHLCVQPKFTLRTAFIFPFMMNVDYHKF